MNRRRWTVVGVVGGAFAAAAAAHYWYRKRRRAQPQPYPGVWDLTKEVAESIDAGKRALRAEELEQEERRDDEAPDDRWEETEPGLD